MNFFVLWQKFVPKYSCSAKAAGLGQIFRLCGFTYYHINYMYVLNDSLCFLELVLNIYIPTKQNNLKSGRALLRIRNTGFTITTCDSPPRCQGTWQIIHIRKYGGSESFRFQTGMLSYMSQIHIMSTILQG